MAASSTIKVCLTGAAGQIAYALLPHLIDKSIFDRPIELMLLDVDGTEASMSGLVMELEDYASPNLKSVGMTVSPAAAFEGCQVAILVGAMPRKAGMQRKDLLRANACIFKVQGEVLERVADRDVKVLVVGNPANTNAFIVSQYAPSIPKENFSAMTRLDHNRAQAQVAKRLGVPVDAVEGVVVWGNHSTTQYPDVTRATVGGKPVRLDEAYVKQELIPLVQNRGAAVIEARKLSSAMSAAKAIADQLRDWLYGSAKGPWVSMGVASDGSYGTAEGTFFSFPVACPGGGAWTIVQDLPLTEYDQAMLRATEAELLAERADAEACVLNCGPDACG